VVLLDYTLELRLLVEQVLLLRQLLRMVVNPEEHLQHLLEVLVELLVLVQDSQVARAVQV
jgi:hypothetical protein